MDGAVKKSIKMLRKHGIQGVGYVSIVTARKYVYVSCEGFLVRIDKRSASKYIDIIVAIAKDVCKCDDVVFSSLK